MTITYTDGRPLVFFDLETTGVNIQTDRIVEISVVKIMQDGTREVKTRRINPEIHIPEEASAVHHITDDDVKDCPTFRQIAKNFFIYLEGCDLGGYNIAKFDIPVLLKEFSRAGLSFSLDGRRIIDAFTIFSKMEPRNLSAAYKFFCGKTMVDAHSAEADTLATVEIFEAQLEHYSRKDPAEFPENVASFPQTLNELHAFCQTQNPDAIDPDGRFKWREGEAIVGFGRNAGVPLRQVATENPDFLRWVIRSDFSKEVKTIATNALQGVFPSRDSAMPESAVRKES